MNNNSGVNFEVGMGLKTLCAVSIYALQSRICMHIAGIIRRNLGTITQLRMYDSADLVRVVAYIFYCIYQ